MSKYTPSQDHQSSHRGIPALPFCKITLKAQKPPLAAYPKELKTLGDHLRKRRLDLKLFQKEVAQKLGVNEDSVCNWENNRTSPSLRFIPKIIEFLGYLPYDAQAKTLGERIVASRKRLGLSQKELARRLGVDPSTLGRWERDESQPLERHLENLVKYLDGDLLTSRRPPNGTPVETFWRADDVVAVERAVTRPPPAQIPACGFLAPGSSEILASAFRLKVLKLPFSPLDVQQSVVVLS